MDYIPGLTVPDQERRLRIVVLYVLFHKCRIRIGIAVPAKMSTGIICSDICPQKAGAFIVPLIPASFRNIESCMESSLKSLYRHTAGTICTI